MKTLNVIYTLLILNTLIVSGYAAGEPVCTKDGLCFEIIVKNPLDIDPIDDQEWGDASSLIKVVRNLRWSLLSYDDYKTEARINHMKRLLRGAKIRIGGTDGKELEVLSEKIDGLQDTSVIHAIDDFYFCTIRVAVGNPQRTFDLTVRKFNDMDLAVRDIKEITKTEFSLWQPNELSHENKEESSEEPSSVIIPVPILTQELLDAAYDHIEEWKNKLFNMASTWAGGDCDERIKQIESVLQELETTVKELEKANLENDAIKYFFQNQLAKQLIEIERLTQTVETCQTNYEKLEKECKIENEKKDKAIIEAQLLLDAANQEIEELKKLKEIGHGNENKIQGTGEVSLEELVKETNQLMDTLKNKTVNICHQQAEVKEVEFIFQKLKATLQKLLDKSKGDPELFKEFWNWKKAYQRMEEMYKANQEQCLESSRLLIQTATQELQELLKAYDNAVESRNKLDSECYNAKATQLEIAFQKSKASLRKLEENQITENILKDDLNTQRLVLMEIEKWIQKYQLEQRLCLMVKQLAALEERTTVLHQEITQLNAQPAQAQQQGLQGLEDNIPVYIDKSSKRIDDSQKFELMIVGSCGKENPVGLLLNEMIDGMNFSGFAGKDGVLKNNGKLLVINNGMEPGVLIGKDLDTATQLKVKGTNSNEYTVQISVELKDADEILQLDTVSGLSESYKQKPKAYFVKIVNISKIPDKKVWITAEGTPTAASLKSNIYNQTRSEEICKTHTELLKMGYPVYLENQYFNKHYYSFWLEHESFYTTKLDILPSEIQKNKFIGYADEKGHLIKHSQINLIIAGHNAYTDIYLEMGQITLNRVESADRTKKFDVTLEVVPFNVPLIGCNESATGFKVRIIKVDPHQTQQKY